MIAETDNHLKPQLLRVLVACEYSGTVREAFAALGHNAMSCDLLPTDRPGKHYQGDVFDVIDAGWDLMICHPPCTYLSVSGIHWNNRGRGWEETDKALNFVRRLMGAEIPRIALENPVSIISSRIRKPDQIVHPHQFGHDASKATCLWLKNLPKLHATDNTPPGSSTESLAGPTRRTADRTNSHPAPTAGNCAPPPTKASPTPWQRNGPTRPHDCAFRFLPTTAKISFP